MEALHHGAVGGHELTVSPGSNGDGWPAPYCRCSTNTLLAGDGDVDHPPARLQRSGVRQAAAAVRVGVAVEDLAPPAVGDAGVLNAVAVAERPVVEAGNHQHVLGRRRAAEGEDAVGVVNVDDLAGARAKRRMRPAQPQDVGIEAEQPRAGALPERQEVLAVVQEVVVPVGPRRTDLLAHEEHGHARRQQGHAGGKAGTRLGITPRLAFQRSAVYGHDDGARRMHVLAVLLVVGVAGFVVRLVVDDAAVGRSRQHAREPRHVERPVVAVAGEGQQARPAGVVLRVADQVVVVVGVPDGVEAHAALLGRLRHRRPAGMVLGGQEHARA